MTWASQYIGIPFVDGGRDAAGCDCWGLVRLVYARHFGIDLPSYSGAYLSAHERAEVAELIHAGRCAGPWLAVEAQAPGDVLCFRVGRHTAHVAISVGSGLMLHAHRDQSKITRQADPAWRSRLMGAWRHKALA